MAVGVAVGVAVAVGVGVGLFSVISRVSATHFVLVPLFDFTTGGVTELVVPATLKALDWSIKVPAPPLNHFDIIQPTGFSGPFAGESCAKTYEPSRSFALFGVKAEGVIDVALATFVDTEFDSTSKVPPPTS